MCTFLNGIRLMQPRVRITSILSKSLSDSERAAAILKLTDLLKRLTLPRPTQLKEDSNRNTELIFKSM